MQYLISDIHANVRELERLLKLLRPGKDDTLIFLGDYIDKLPHTRETLALLHALREECACVFLRGNHEFVWERYLRGEARRRDFLLQYGGREALRGLGPDAVRALEEDDAAYLRDALQPYLALMEYMRDWHIAGGFLALHAGLLPGQYRQSPLVFREENYFVRPEDIPREERYLGRYVLVAGHTHLGEKPTVDAGYINIDLGAGYGNYLGACCVERNIVIRSDGREFPL